MSPSRAVWLAGQGSNLGADVYELLRLGQRIDGRRLASYRVYDPSLRRYMPLVDPNSLPLRCPADFLRNAPDALLGGDARACRDPLRDRGLACLRLMPTLAINVRDLGKMPDIEMYMEAYRELLLHNTDGLHILIKPIFHVSTLLVVVVDVSVVDVSC